MFPNDCAGFLDENLTVFLGNFGSEIGSEVYLIIVEEYNFFIVDQCAHVALEPVLLDLWSVILSQLAQGVKSR